MNHKNYLETIINISQKYLEKTFSPKQLQKFYKKTEHIEKLTDISEIVRKNN